MKRIHFNFCVLLIFVLIPCYGQTQVHTANGIFMNDWLILGPISGIDLEKDYLEAAGGESQIEPKEGDKFETEDGQSLTWTRNQSNQDLIDFLYSPSLDQDS